jgi:glutamyl-tRNA synthetase
MAPLTGRYAPSPTGALHLGNLRTALAAWLDARSRRGRFLLRVEDLDTPRVRPGCAGQQLADLRAIGIDWDDEPWVQSRRAAEYARWFDRLPAPDRVYRCFCSRRDVQEALSAPHADPGRTGYPNTCRALDHAAAGERAASGAQHCWRLRVPDEPVVVHDRLAGELAFDLGREGGDFVVRRADGLFAYQFACALDDALSGVTDVVRGADLLDSAARQTVVLESLGLAVPVYAHLPLMRGPDGRRLSKRDGDDDLRALAARGLDATGVAAYLGWTLGACARGERAAPAAMVARFDPDKIPRHEFTVTGGDLDAFRG